MAKVSLQFHARRDEIAQFVTQWINELGLWLAVETLTPAYGSTLLAQGQLSGELRLSDSVGRIALSLYPMEMNSSGSFGLVGKNSTALSVLVRREFSAVLGESVLQAMTDEPRSLSAWRRIRKGMIAGGHNSARAVNSVTGAEIAARDHYFSSGARGLYAHGVRMTGLADLISYKFD